MSNRTMVLPLLVVVALAGACGDDDGADAAVPEAGATAPVAPPTTYLVVRTGSWVGTVGEIGTITFFVRETDASTHETLADGQVIVYDFAVHDVEVVLDLDGRQCGPDLLEGEFTVQAPGPILIDPGGGFAAEIDGLTIEGNTYGGASGTLSVALDGPGCGFGPVPWEAEVG